MDREYIDLETWDRKELFSHYVGTDFPYILITTEVEISKLHSFTQRNDISFYFAMVFAATTVANTIKNFHYRFADRKPFFIQHNRPIITHLQPGSEFFVLLEGARADNLVEFCRRTREKAQGEIANHGTETVRGQEDIIIYSCLPWFRYTQFIRPIARAGKDCNPKISWGKFERQGERLALPFSVQVHHALIDGYHLGLYFARLQHYLDDQGWL